MTDTTKGGSAYRDGEDAPTQTLPATTPMSVPELTGVGAGIVGAALTTLGVWGLHVLTRADGVAGAVGWVILLCVAFSALGKGITLLRRALAPLSAVLSASVAGVPPLLRALVGIVIGAAGIWWVMRGHATFWWTQLAGSGPVWSLPAQLMLVAIIAVAGALVFGGSKTLGKLLFTNSGTRALTRDSKGKWALWWSSHPGLGLSLLAGGATLVFLSGYVVPQVSGWLSGDDPMAALAAITAILALALLANTWWWRALSGWWTWAHTPNHPGGPTPIGQIYAGAGVLALIAFSATAFGLATFASYLPATTTVASADPCGPDGCGGGGNGQGSYGPDTGNFQPPQMPAQQPDYQGGINQPPLDQNSGISIYNETPGQGGQQAPQQNMGPQMPGQRAAHGEPLPNYGPWQPDTQPPVQQAPQPVQQAPVQQAPQAPQQPAQAPQPAQQAPAPEQMPAQHPVQQAPQQPVQQGQPGQTQPQKPPEQAPPKEPDAPKKSVIDPTDLAVAATRRGSQQAGQQAVQQGTAQAVSKSSQIATQMSGTATNMSGPAPAEPAPGPPPYPQPDGVLWTWHYEPHVGWMQVYPQTGQPYPGAGQVPPTNTNPAPPSTPKPSPTQSPNLGPEIRDTLPDPKDPTEVLHQWADLAGKIDAHNAKIVNPSDPLQVSEYEAEFLELNSKLLELSAEMLSLGIPHEILPAPNSITIGGN
ncbi:hypothetical protein [Mycobacteroides abscessus]|uniref:hypothetical protein n=1 Tax=Mycobacteroides abscessus TaxID=36809 RepID=UPI00031CEB8E|nr:hypothetical protein [Mycobacteroides abscessus]